MASPAPCGRGDEAAAAAAQSRVEWFESRRAGWVLSLCPAAGEGGGSFRPSLPPLPGQRGGPDPDKERSAAEAARRARSTLRRYCAANRLNRLGTLTYAGDGNHDVLLLREHVAAFFRRLRRLVDAELPYVWTAEWHKSGHGLHVHFAVGRYVPRSVIEAAWPHGFVHIKLLGDLPVGSGSLGQARKAAGYLSKYISKAIDDDRRPPGRHRYEVAQGFQPVVVEVWATTCDGVIVEASTVMGAQPERVWTSAELEDWDGPPLVWVQWPG